MSDLQAQATEVLQNLIRFNTVNPPGNERAAIEYLEAYVREAGFETELLGVEHARPNLIATLTGPGEGPTMVYLGHVDTVLAAAQDWQHDPWSGDVVDGLLWGRGALDMKSQVAAEAVAAVALARDGWRPARGTLKLVFVADEETGGTVGARWLTEQRPDKVRCDLLLNEGAGSTFEHRGVRHYGVCCGEKGIFRLKLTASGMAGHASMPRLGENATGLAVGETHRRTLRFVERDALSHRLFNRRREFLREHHAVHNDSQIVQQSRKIRPLRTQRAGDLAEFLAHQRAAQRVPPENSRIDDEFLGRQDLAQRKCEHHVFNTRDAHADHSAADRFRRA